MTRHVAVIDIGKTNAKVALVDLADVREVALRRMANAPVADGPYPHHDVELLWSFILDSLAEINREQRIEAISITTHGATGVLVDAAGELALPVLDYEFAGPDTLAEDYDSDPSALCRDGHAAPAGRPQSRRAAVLAAEALPGGVRQGRRDADVPAILGVAPDRRRRQRSDLARLPHRSVEPVEGGFFVAGRQDAMAPSDGAGAAGEGSPRTDPARPCHTDRA